MKKNHNYHQDWCRLFFLLLWGTLGIPSSSAQQITFEKELVVKDLPSGSCPVREKERTGAIAQEINSRAYYIAGGYTESPCNVVHGSVLKLKPNGDPLWLVRLPQGYYKDIKCVYNAGAADGLIAAGSCSDHNG